jgi:hypothetical protein
MTYTIQPRDCSQLEVHPLAFFGNPYKAARRNNRRASSCHRERAAEPGAERSKLAKPTLWPSACVPQPVTHPP